MGKGKLSGSPFHIETFNDVVRGATNTRLYNPPLKKHKKCPYLRNNFCYRNGPKVVCRYWACEYYQGLGEKKKNRNAPCMYCKPKRGRVHGQCIFHSSYYPCTPDIKRNCFRYMRRRVTLPRCQHSSNKGNCKLRITAEKCTQETRETCMKYCYE